MSKTNIHFLVLSILLFSCTLEKSEVPQWQRQEGSNLKFELELNPEMYRLSNFGEPPQMALWLENKDGSEIRTLWVSNRLARGVWVGKVICPTALPYWISRREIEKGGWIPSFLKPLPDGITGATPKATLEVYTHVNPGSEWRYFLELNVSGDYNSTFRSSQPNGNPDPDGNGQPSLVYSGSIQATTGWSDTAQVVGRTEQMVAISDILPDMEGFTTARHVLKSLIVNYTETGGISHE
jgi:hypothetical protein